MATVLHLGPRRAATVKTAKNSDRSAVYEGPSEERIHNEDDGGNNEEDDQGEAPSQQEDAHHDD